MKSFLNTVLGGAIGLIALYVVGRVAYQAGRDMAQAEKHYEEVCKKTKSIEPKLNNIDETPNLEEAKSFTIIRDEPNVSNSESMVEYVRNDNENSKPESYKKKRFGPIGKLRLILGLKRRIEKKESVIGRLIHNPEAHRIEAFVEGGELKLNVKPRTA